VAWATLPPRRSCPSRGCAAPRLALVWAGQSGPAGKLNHPRDKSSSPTVSVVLHTSSHGPMARQRWPSRQSAPRTSAHAVFHASSGRDLPGGLRPPAAAVQRRAPVTAGHPVSLRAMVQDPSSLISSTAYTFMAFRSRSAVWLSSS
jgi:hypothetical protein